ncbi:TetR/AcrR family transcriptional regulator [Kitasatospora sp. NPDC052896]|uniref:TetR/AcrR family transcriptional regulator n=1 Tax=Kitasatospora sp. NPDC052896 TaxID=3364061 RepID=UPI0037C8797C
MARASIRMTAEERRESVIRAALIEFARGGYHGTSTEAIARRVGVSQPYLFRLFPGKQAIFIEACRRCCRDVWQAFDRASEGLTGAEARAAMGAAYLEFIADRDQLLMQMQMQVAVAGAEAGGDVELGEAVRASWVELWENSRLRMGGDHLGAAEFFGQGMLINALVAMGFPMEHPIWAFYDEGDEEKAEQSAE